MTRSLEWLLPLLIVAAGCASPAMEPGRAKTLSEFEIRRMTEIRNKLLAEAAEQRAMEERADAARRRKAERLANAERTAQEEQTRMEREKRTRQTKIAEAQRRELEKQDRHRQAIAKAKGESSSMPIITATYDHAVKNGKLAEEIGRIRKNGSDHVGVVLGGFRLGMDIQDAYLLARVLFKGVSLEPDSYRGSLRVRIGESKQVDMSDNLEGAFVAGLFGNDASFVFAEADPGTREVTAFRFTAEMAKNLIGVESPVSNDQLARTVFLRLGLDWEYNFEYDVYSFTSSTEAFHGYLKTTKLSNSLTVVNPGDFTLRR